jgi:hypothetical protein
MKYPMERKSKAKSGDTEPYKKADLAILNLVPYFFSTAALMTR